MSHFRELQDPPVVTVGFKKRINFFVITGVFAGSAK